VTENGVEEATRVLRELADELEGLASAAADDWEPRTRPPTGSQRHA